MTKRRRSTFRRRGGKPYGQEARDTAAVDATAREIQQLTAKEEMREMDRAMMGALAPVLARIEAVGIIAAELQSYLPREIEVTVIGMTGDPMQAVEVGRLPDGTVVLALPAPDRDGAP